MDNIDPKVLAQLHTYLKSPAETRKRKFESQEIPDSINSHMARGLMDPKVNPLQIPLKFLLTPK